MTKKAQADPLSSLVTVLSVVYPMSALPQIVQIFNTQSVAGISALMWLMQIMFAIPFLIYSFRIKSKPLVINHGLWIMMYVIIFTQVIVYS